jgi:hypothetical protein
VLGPEVNVREEANWTVLLSDDVAGYEVTAGGVSLTPVTDTVPPGARSPLMHCSVPPESTSHVNVLALMLVELVITQALLVGNMVNPVIA